MKKYRLYKGFGLIGEFETIKDAKDNCPKDNGVYNLIGDNYRDTWEWLNGVLYN